MASAQTILSIRTADAGRLFSGSPEDIRAQFRKLAKIWHPDRSADPKAGDVFARIVDLRDAALKAGGSKPALNKLAFTTRDGRPFTASPIASRMTDLGKVHIGRRTTFYEYETGFDDVARKERDHVEAFRFADDKMRQQMASGLPVLAAHADLQGDAALNIFERPVGEILLADFLEAFGDMPDIHAAWLGSGLLNIACYLQWAGIVHGAIGLDTVMVNPETHAVRLVGGWGFAVKAGRRPAMLPNRTLDLFPSMAVAGQVAGHDLDLELIRRTLREMLGDPAGSRLKSIGVADPLANFVMMPAGRTAYEDYASWQRALEAAWGPRRFIKFAGTAREVYGLK